MPKSTSKAIDVTRLEREVYKEPIKTFMKTEKVTFVQKLEDSGKINSSQARISREEIEELKKRFGTKRQTIMNQNN